METVVVINLPTKPQKNSRMHPGKEKKVCVWRGGGGGQGEKKLIQEKGQDEMQEIMPPRRKRAIKKWVL